MNGRNFGIKIIAQVFCQNDAGFCMYGALILKPIFQVGKMSLKDLRYESRLKGGDLEGRERELHLLFMPLFVFGKFTQDMIRDYEGDRGNEWFPEMLSDDPQAIGSYRMVLR